MLKLKEAKQLGNQFASELQDEFDTPLIWWFIGSIKDGKYIAGKSDIDMVILPAKEGMFSLEAIKRVLAKIEDYKKYGVVFKKGRDISLIDVLIMVDLKAVNYLRDNYYEARK